MSRIGSPLPKSVVYRRRWQGATTRNSWRYSEEEQRSQRRRDAPELVTDFRFGTLGAERDFHLIAFEVGHRLDRDGPSDQSLEPLDAAALLGGQEGRDFRVHAEGDAG